MLNPSVHARLLDPEQSLLLIVDVQEKFAPVIPDFDRLLNQIRILVETAQQLELPVVVSEQYKKGLGDTVQELKAVLPASASIFEKTAFGCLQEADIANHIALLNRKQIILTGIEAHVCVNQSAHQLLAHGYQVHLVEDAISSRTHENRALAMQKMIQSGAIPSSCEMAIFELLQNAKHPCFKEIQNLVK